MASRMLSTYVITILCASAIADFKNIPANAVVPEENLLQEDIKVAPVPDWVKENHNAAYDGLSKVTPLTDWVTNNHDAAYGGGDKFDKAAHLAGIPEFKDTPFPSEFHAPAGALSTALKAPCNDTAPKKGPSCGGCACTACCGTGRCTCEAPGSEAFKKTRCGAHLALIKTKKARAKDKKAEAKDKKAEAKDKKAEAKDKKAETKAQKAETSPKKAKAALGQQLESEEKAAEDDKHKAVMQKKAIVDDKKKIATQKKAVKAANKLQGKTIAKAKLEKQQQKQQISEQMQDQNMAIKEYKKMVANEWNKF